MGTIYYCACLDCKSLVDLDKFYMVPSLDEFFDIEYDAEIYKDNTHYNRHTIFLLTFLLRHSGHRIVLGCSGLLDEYADNWYDTFTRELEVYK